MVSYSVKVNKLKAKNTYISPNLCKGILLLLVFSLITGCSSHNRRGINSIVSLDDLAYKSRPEVAFVREFGSRMGSFPIIEALKKSQYFSKVEVDYSGEVKTSGFTVQIETSGRDVTKKAIPLQLFLHFASLGIIPLESNIGYKFEVKIYRDGDLIDSSSYYDIVDEYMSFLGPWAYFYGHDYGTGPMSPYVKKDMAAMVATQILHKISIKQ